MASLGHVAVGLAMARALVPAGESCTDAMWALGALAMWPDIDVVAFSLGIPYSSPYGHRGATHSLAAALVAGACAAFLWRRSNWGRGFGRTLAATTLVALSHPLLDTLTFGGGLGCALLWPFAATRYWSPVRFIPIAPIGLGMFSAQGLFVIAAELLLFAPLWLYAIWPRRSL